MDLFPDFRDLLAAFAAAKVDAVLIGGYAVAFHGRPRSTKDLDLFVRLSDDNRRRVAEALDTFGAPTSVVKAARVQTPGQVLYFGAAPLRVDIVADASGIDFDEVFESAVDALVDGVPVKVICLDLLIANKRAAGRPQDLRDAQELEKVRARIGGP